MQDEPANFEAKVRIPGNNFLASNPNPNGKQFKPNSFWKTAKKELHAAYKGVCAYTCMYIMLPDSSVDHFLPKSSHPGLAYEWKNYRLSAPRVNLYKGDSIELIDPVGMTDKLFNLDFPSCLVIPAQGLGDALRARVDRTIEKLKLNLDDTFVQERCDMMVEYARGDVTLEFLSRRYPFLALEVKRQGLEGNVINIFKNRA